MSYYTSPPTSPLSGFFPTAPAAPHAFAGFQQDPRATHAVYAALGPGAAHNARAGQKQQRQAHATGSLRKKLSK